ncbi:MAG: hypothetical protein IJK98_03760 [Clostridia bacterium]|nr:hypothetical protein [Clostridia bacterium]
MDNFDKMLQRFVNMDYEEIFDNAKRVMVESLEILNRKLPEEQSMSALLYFIACAVAIDGTFSAMEQKFIADLFGNVDFMELLKTVDASVTRAMDNLVDNLSTEEKSVFCLLAICILSVDEKINKDEYIYLNRLIG